MKKAPFAVTTLAALTVTAVAFAQDAAGAGPTSTPNATPPPDIPVAPAPPLGEETQITTITAAELTPPPAPSPTPAPKETITVRQSYRPNRPLLYTGGAILLGSYAATAAATRVRSVRDGNKDQPTYIPVAGPWLYLANTPSASMLDKIAIGASGVIQGAGVVLGVLSFIVPERVPVATIEAKGVRMNVGATSFGAGSGGIGAVGEF